MLTAALLDLVLPRTCSGCDLPGAGLCVGCRALLRGPSRGKVRPTPCPVGLPTVVALLPYDGLAKRLLLAHKERGRLSLTRPLAAGLATAVLDLGLTGPVVLCPVPSARSAVRARGHDHALRLARATADEVRRRGGPVVAQRLLAPARSVADQSHLTTAQRAANLHAALRARTGLPASTVVIVDDVMTTGATLVEATRALASYGHVVLGAAVIASTERRAVSHKGV